MLEVSYWKLLEVILFISPNTFWRVGKLHDFGYRFLGTLGDALISLPLSLAFSFYWWLF
jgi:hypothetical protein